MQLPCNAWALTDYFEVRRVTVVRSAALGKLIDDKGHTYPSVRIFSSREAAEEKGLLWMKNQEKQLAQYMAKHERRKANVATYRNQ